jgi:hypothetical protein
MASQRPRTGGRSPPSIRRRCARYPITPFVRILDAASSTTIDIKGELKMKNFDRVGVCLKWLGEIAQGMTWDQHMRECMMKVWEERATEGHTFDVTAPPLFEVGGVLGVLSRGGFPP